MMTMKLQSLICIGSASGRRRWLRQRAAARGAADAARSPTRLHATRPADPPAPMREPIPPEPLPADSVAGRSLDDLNRDSPLQPIFFDYDSSDVNDAGRGILQANAAVLKKYPSWVITIEGHCDERGTAEYNLALGERRAVSARTYLVSLGIDANRLRTVSYGSEFPFDPAHRKARGAGTAARIL